MRRMFPRWVTSISANSAAARIAYSLERELAKATPSAAMPPPSDPMELIRKTAKSNA